MASLQPSPRWVSVAFFLALCALVRNLPFPYCLAQPTQSRNRVDWVLVLDTSESMIGHGKGAKDIFDKVKDSIKKFIDRAEPGDTVTLYRFDQAVEKIGGGARTITNQADKEDLKKSVASIPARGLHTHTGEAVREVLKTSADLKGLPDAANRAVMIVLFTDGQEDVADMKNPFRLSDLSINQKESELPYTYLVWLTGEEPNQEIKDALGKLNGQIIKAPGETTINEVINKVPKTQPPKAEAAPPTEVTLSMDPDAVDFGKVEPGKQTDTKIIHCRSSAPIRVQLSIESADGGGITLAEPKEAFDLRPNETADIKMGLATASGIEEGPRTLKLTLAPTSPTPNVVVTPAAIHAQLSLAKKPVFEKLLPWIVAAVALALVALIFLRWQERQKYLEGELEVLRPRPAQPEQAFIALSELQRKRARLSELLPQDATKDANADLLTVRKNGSKLVQIKRTQGIVRVNKVEIEEFDLYNSDEIELGNARVRFNSLQERPPANPE